MEIVPVPVRALPLEMDPGVALRGRRAPGVVARIVFRVIGCLVAARP
ncbi:MAG TPA: hypothetical protein VF386_15105 [Usitatibacter sp.]